MKRDLAAIYRIVGLPEEQREYWNERWLHRLIPPGNRVIASRQTWWFLNDQRVMCEWMWAGPDVEKVDYIVLAGESVHLLSDGTVDVSRPITDFSYGPPEGL